MTRVKSPLTVVAEYLRSTICATEQVALYHAENIMDRLATCRLPEDQSLFKLNDPATVAQRVLLGCTAMERMGLDPLFIHDVRRLAASVKSAAPEQHQPLIQAVLAHAESQAMCEALDPPEHVWQRNDELNRALDEAVQTYVNTKRKEYEDERGR